MHRTVHGATRLVLAAVVVLVAASPVLAGTTGEIAGTVTTDKREPLAGVNVRIVGLRLGAITDDKGRYSIIGVPGGQKYSVQFNLMGYGPQTTENVLIRADFETELNVSLKVEALQQEEVRVEAERPLLQKDATGTTRFIQADDIQKLPTRGYKDAAANQTGVVNFQRQIDTEASNSNTLIIRGGRPNETAYFVDGFSQQDPLTGTSSTAISNSAISEVVLMTGGFSPEYGRIMSGAVNVLTKEGGRKYFGALDMVTDEFSGNWVGAPQTGFNVYDGSIGGPVLPGNEKITFYLSGERRWQQDRQPATFSDLFKSELSTLGLGNDVTPNNSSSSFAYQGKLAWSLSDQMTLKAGTLGSQDSWHQYVHPYLYNLDHAPRYQDKNQSYFVTLNQAVNPKTIWNAGVNFFQTDRKRGDGLAFDNLDPRYVHTGPGGDTLISLDGVIQTPGGYFRDPNPRFNINLPLFFDPGHVFEDYLQRKSSYYGIQAGMTTMLTPRHQMKFGGDFQRHTLRYFDHYFPDELGGTGANLSDFDAYGYKLDPTYRDVVIRDENTETGEVTFDTTRVLSGLRLVENSDGDPDGPKHPKSFSLYVQDKYEREGLTVNGGLRLDYINTDTQALVSESFPLGDPDSDVNPDSLESDELQSNRSYTKILPRVGIAFPVDDKTIFRFNYGQFYQQPNLQDLYVSYRFLQYKIRRGGYFVGFGNPNLKPEHTTAYEAAIQRQLGSNIRLDVTAYYKDVKDLVQIATIPSFPNNFSSYRNQDFATIKGLDFGFAMRPISHFSANLNYSLSYAQGTGSVSQTNRNRAWTANQPPKQTAPLDFDQRHKLSANFDWRLNRGEGPEWRGRRWLDGTGLNLLINVASGTPYTPTNVYNELTLAAVSPEPSGSLNSRYGPWTATVDFKASKGFGFGLWNIEAYAWVLNLFNNENAITVYTSSGTPYSTTFLNTQPGEAFVQTAAEQEGVDGEALYRLAEDNPSLFASPRLVRFGLRMSF